MFETRWNIMSYKKYITTASKLSHKMCGREVHHVVSLDPLHSLPVKNP